MRDMLKKTVAVAMIAGAALAVTACSKTESVNTTENVTTTSSDTNAMEPMEGSMNDMSANSSSNMM